MHHSKNKMGEHVCLHVCMCMPDACGTGDKCGYEPLCRCWEVNLGPLQEWQAPLMIKSSFQPPKYLRFLFAIWSHTTLTIHQRKILDFCFSCLHFPPQGRGHSCASQCQFLLEFLSCRTVMVLFSGIYISPLLNEPYFFFACLLISLYGYIKSNKVVTLPFPEKFCYWVLFKMSLL